MTQAKTKAAPEAAPDLDAEPPAETAMDKFFRLQLEEKEAAMRNPLGIASEDTAENEDGTPVMTRRYENGTVLTSVHGTVKLGV